jgi:hypothetical protein
MEWEQYAEVIRLLLTTAPHDPAVADQLRKATDVNRGAPAAVINRLANFWALRRGVEVAHAVDVLWLRILGRIALVPRTTAGPTSRQR